MSLEKFAELTSTSPAKLFGLYPEKGIIAVGSDADLTIWDADREVTISNDLLHHAADHTPYAWQTVRGWPVMTISRGDLVWDDGEIYSIAGRGRFIPRKRPFARQQELSRILGA
jgi:dihydropyrimidinase